MKKVGIVLVIIEIICLIAGIVSGELAVRAETDSYWAAYYIGYLLPGIIGIILINKANKKKDK